ncbi:hypothetical protein [Bacillus gaemokensis]|nr:hypothetical protein [Bacillus gaemokensis]
MKKILIFLVVLLGVSICVLEEESTDYSKQYEVSHLVQMTDPGGGW